MSLFEDSEHVRPLRNAENRFLQALVTQFSLHRRGARGAELRVTLDDGSPVIWSRAGKYAVHARIPDFSEKATRYQEALDGFFFEGRDPSYTFNDPAFPFRYASGGALPVLAFAGRHYYCLFYRDIFPIGWNIANGGCDTRNELLYPMVAAERELREELIIWNPSAGTLSVFEHASEKPMDHPDFRLARRLWRQRLPQADFFHMEQVSAPMKWIAGPDRLRVGIGSDAADPLTGCFLNVNAEDFGIEIDRVAVIKVDEGAVLLDGEVSKDHLINRPVGLFDVDRLDRELQDGADEFLPDVFFFDGIRYDAGAELHDVIENDYLPGVQPVRLREETEHYTACQSRFDLCPVTRRLLRRYGSLPTVTTPPVPAEDGGYQVFVSFGGDDLALAEEVYRYLVGLGLSVFFYRETVDHPDFQAAIDAALESADCLVAVATSRENLLRRWPRYEWRSFFQDIQFERKDPARARIIAFVSGLDPRDLPRPLRQYQAIDCRDDRQAAFNQLARFLGGAAGMATP